MARVAANVATHKESRPDLYCPERRCLWRTGGDYCPRHFTPAKEAARVRATEATTPASSSSRPYPSPEPAPALPGADVASCGCIRRFVAGRLQTVKCSAHVAGGK